MMWVIFALSLIELIVVHLFVALKWPLIGWTLTILSALSAIWLVFWILSFKRLPHQLRGDELTLRFGSMKRVALELGNIACVKTDWEQGALNQKTIINLAGIAHPNRCLELKQPIEKGKVRIFARFDDALSFDKAMQLSLIHI